MRSRRTGASSRPLEDVIWARPRLTLHFRGDLTDEQRQKLTAIADRCPVHRTLEAGARIRAGAKSSHDPNGRGRSDAPRARRRLLCFLPHRPTSNIQRLDAAPPTAVNHDPRLPAQSQVAPIIALLVPLTPI
jgi:hypothetical protein